MKRLIIAQIKIELDNERSDYEAAMIAADWKTVVADYLYTTQYRIGQYCSIEIDETKPVKWEK